MSQRPLASRAVRRNSVLALALYALGTVFALAGFASITEIVLEPGLLVGLAGCDVPILGLPAR
jgi:hypothetical protein